MLNNYLKSKINGWYENAMIDYGVSGKFISTETRGHELYIKWEEEGEIFDTVISWYTEYTPEQLYNIWMECA